MTNLYRGIVTFTMPLPPDAEEGATAPTFRLRLGVNAFIAAQDQLKGLNGVEHLRLLFHTALINVEDQQALTLEDAGDIIDELGIDETNALVAKTKWGIHTDRAIARAQAALDEATKKAAEMGVTGVPPPLPDPPHVTASTPASR